MRRIYKDIVKYMRYVLKFAEKIRAIQGQDTIKTQITYEKRDYLKLQDDLFKGISVEGIYKKAKKHAN